MEYCKKCVQPDTRPGIIFVNGVCGACVYEEEKARINWQERRDELHQIADWARNQQRTYDCAIGVSGGKDTTFQAFYARDTLGLHPLLVNCEPDEITDIGRHNIENLKQSGFDTITIRPNPKVLRGLMRRDFFRYLNPGKVTEYCLWASTYIIADTFNIPLVIQGENASYTQGVRGCISLGGDCLDAINKRTTADDRYEIYTDGDVTERHLFFYGYDIEKLRAKDIRGVWLGYYVQEWAQRTNARFAIEHGMHIRPPHTNPRANGTYIRYFQLDSNLVFVNQFLKWVKFGFGQTTDHANYDIRDGHITREEGIALVKAFDGKCAPRYRDDLCRTIGISLQEFDVTVARFWGPMFDKPYTIKEPIWEQFPPQVDVDAVIRRLDKILDKNVDISVDKVLQ